MAKNHNKKYAPKLRHRPRHSGGLRQNEQRLCYVDTDEQKLQEA